MIEFKEFGEYCVNITVQRTCNKADKFGTILISTHAEYWEYCIILFVLVTWC